MNEMIEISKLSRKESVDIKRYSDISEKERFLREILEKNRDSVKKRDNLVIVNFQIKLEKGGFSKKTVWK